VILLSSYEAKPFQQDDQGKSPCSSCANGHSATFTGPSSIAHRKEGKKALTFYKSLLLS
jgi:hypothetical protein